MKTSNNVPAPGQIGECRAKKFLFKDSLIKDKRRFKNKLLLLKM